MDEVINTKIIFEKEYTASKFARDALFYFNKFTIKKYGNDIPPEVIKPVGFTIIYGVSGKGFINYKDKIISLGKNDLIILEKVDSFLISVRDAEMFILDIDSVTAKYYYDQMKDERGIVSIVDFRNIIFFFHKLKELIACTNVNEVYVSLSLEAIFTDVYTEKFYESKIEEPHSNAIVLALFYIETNIASKITLKELADFVGYSVFHFSRLFKEELGISPYEYVINYRLDLAKHMLKTTNLNIKYVAERCGYINETNFYSIFKKRENISPKQYRKENSNDENISYEPNAY